MGAKCSKGGKRRQIIGDRYVQICEWGETVMKVHLKSIEVEVQVNGYVATVTSILQYVNEENRPVQAMFTFPFPVDVAVCHFSAKTADHEVVAEVHEKQEAQEEHDEDAPSLGQQAFLLEECKERPNAFRLVVGSLPANESVAVTLSYVTELAVQADFVYFCLPDILNPQYDLSNLDKKKQLVSLSLSVHITSPLPISKVESSCDLEPLIYLNTAQTQAQVNLSPGHKFDKVVELLLYYQDAAQSTVIVEAGCTNAEPGSLMGDSVLMLNLYPEFPPEVMSSIGKHGEFIFLMDQSGSMAGSLIRSARETLLLLIKSLPLGCYFNIYGFGSSFKSLFRKSVEYTQVTMEKAKEKVSEMEADMVGTEILKPLKHIYEQNYIPHHPRQVFVFTDGDVKNTEMILDLVRAHSSSTRCFTFGIGHEAGTALIRGMASEGRGIAHFITSKERLQLRVMQSLSYSLQPSVTDISVNWTVPEGVSVTTLSPPIKVLFQGQKALLYIQLTGKSSGTNEGSVTVNYKLADQLVTNQLNFSLIPAEDSGLAIHRLAAQSLIQSLEMEQKKTNVSLREKVMELSVQAGVSSTFTSFLAVQTGNREPVTGPELHGYCGFVAGHETRINEGAISEFSSVLMSTLPHTFHGHMIDREEGMGYSLHGAHSAEIDSYTKLISLQKAEGYWTLESEFITVFSKTKKKLTQSKPAQVDNAVWATVLALVWLHGFWVDDVEEWNFIAIKATSWIQSQKVENLTNCIQAANAVLGCRVKEEDLDL